MKEPWSKKPLCQEPFGALYTEMSGSSATERAESYQRKKSKIGKKVELIIANCKWNWINFPKIFSFHSLKNYIWLSSTCILRLGIYFTENLGSTMMDDCMRRLAQLFFCLHTLRNMPSLWGYHSINPHHSSLADAMTGFSYCPPIPSLSWAVITLMWNLLSSDL